MSKKLASLHYFYENSLLFLHFKTNEIIFMTNFDQILGN